MPAAPTPTVDARAAAAARAAPPAPGTARRCRIVALNSLDARYGSTYRFRALADLLRAAGHDVAAWEGAGSALRRLGRAMGAALGRYDLLFTQKFNPVTLAAIAVARLRGRPVLVDWDDFDPGLQGSPGRRWLATACEAVGPFLASGITTHSEPIRARAAATGRPVHLVPQGYDDALFRPDPARRAAARARFGFGPDDRVVGHLCTFTHGGSLDLPVILAAWRQLADPQLRFFLIGGGPREDEVRRALRAAGLTARVRLTGLLPHAEVPDALRCLDVGVVYMSDSAANRARVSFKVVEYLALDVPVVGQLVGESARLFGAHVTPATATTLATVIRTVAADSASRRTAAAVAAYRWSESQAALAEAVATVARSAPCA
jgi:glycosyltransferase involved in cell wall biosynthesis